MVSQSDIISDLRRVNSRVDGTVTKQDYSEHGEHSVSSLYREIGSIVEARKQAGIDGNPRSETGASKQELLDAIHELAEDLGRAPKRDEMIESGEFSEGPYRRVFESWGKAVKQAGYEPHRPLDAEEISYICPQCGTEDTKPETAIGDNQQNIFCSRSCKHDWQAENVVGENHHQYDQVKLPCDWCGDTVRRKPAVVEEKDHFFCDRDCYGQWCSENRTGEAHPRWTGGDIELNCDVCGEPFQVRATKRDQARFCSYECMGRVRQQEYRGENNPNWTEGVVGYYGENWHEQRYKRLEYDNFACVDCGMTRQQHYNEYDRDLIVHHVQPRRVFVEDGELDWKQANRIQNLRTVCEADHKKWEGIPVCPQ